MQLPAPASECTDAELQTVWDHYTRRQPQPLEPMSYANSAVKPTPPPTSSPYAEHALFMVQQAAHAASEIDDEPEKRPHFVDRLIRDRPGILGGAALGICLFIALAVALWPN